MNRSIVSLWAGAGLLAGVLYAGAAQAEECAPDKCPEGWTCELVSVACDVAVSDAPDGTRPSRERGSSCETAQVVQCVPPPPEECDPAAATDTCSDNTVCLAIDVTTCDAVEAPPPATGGETEGDDSARIKRRTERAGCRSETKGVCVPPYFAPCKVDRNCGPEGFTCVEREACSCSAGSGSTGSTGDGGDEPAPVDRSRSRSRGGEIAADPPEEARCSCEPTGTRYCELEQLPCGDGGKCPDGFSCIEAPRSLACALDSTGASSCDEGEPAASYCAPDDAAKWAHGRELFAGDASSSASGAATGIPYAELVNRAISSGADGEASDTTVEVAADPSQGAAGSGEEDDDAAAAPDPEGEADATGCRTAPSPKHAAPWALLLPLLAVRRRRARRRRP